jgi:hypothetical protein
MKDWHLIGPAALALAAGCAVFAGDGRVIRGSGTIAAENRPVGGFSAVALLGSGEVVLTQGATEGVTVEADDNLLQYVRTDVRGGTLELGFDDAGWRERYQPSRPIRFLVSLRTVSALDLAGAGSLTATQLDAEALTLALNGAGDITLAGLAAETLRASLSGTGNIALAGRVDGQEVQLSGAGDYQAGDLESQHAEVALSGTGEITLWVRQALDVTLSGTGAVNYFGQPTLGRREITGVGDINPMGEK